MSFKHDLVDAILRVKQNGEITKRVEVEAIEQTYNDTFVRIMDDVDSVTHPGRHRTNKKVKSMGARSCDGYFEHTTRGNKSLRCIMEYKYNSRAHDFVSCYGMANALIQVIFYMHDIKVGKIVGANMPNMILLGDNKHCVIIPVTNVILSLLDYKNVGWSGTPSSAYIKNNWFAREIESLMVKEKIEFRSYGIDDKFSLRTVVNAMESILDKRNVEVLDINKENITFAFQDFCKYVLPNKEQNLSTNVKLAKFMEFFSAHKKHFLVDTVS